jgi:hypothetical protein
VHKIAPAKQIYSQSVTLGLTRVGGAAHVSTKGWPRLVRADFTIDSSSDAITPREAEVAFGPRWLSQPMTKVLNRNGD